MRSNRPVIAEITGPKPLPLPAAEGFFSLASLKDVLSRSGLKGLDLADLDRELFPGKPAGAGAVVRIVNDGSEGSLATVITFRKGRFELGHFVDGNLQSELWKALSPDALGQGLKGRKHIVRSPGRSRPRS